MPKKRNQTICQATVNGITYRVERNQYEKCEVRWSENGRSKRESLRTTDEAIAQERFNGWLVGEAEFQKENGLPTIGGVFDYYLTNRLPEMIDQKAPVRIFDTIKRVLGEAMPIAHIMPPQISMFIEVRKSEGMSNATIKNELQTLISAMNYCVRHRAITPEQRPVIHVPLQVEPRTSLVTRAEWTMIIKEAQRRRGDDGAPARIESYLMMLWHTGAREGAIRELMWPKISLETGLIDFRIDGRKKTKKRRPVVPASTELHEYLRYAFQFKKNNNYLGTTGSIRHTLSSVLKKAGCPHVTPHDFRRTFVTEAIESGVSIEHVAGMTGDSIATLEAHYNHLRPDRLVNSVNFRGKTGAEGAQNGRVL